MKCLAIETSVTTLSVALVTADSVVAQQTQTDTKQHSVALVPAVEQLLQEAQWQPQDLTAVVVAHGPGSYTGLRIGVTFAKTLAWTLSIPLYTVSSLLLLAASAPSNADTPVVALYDARRKHVYNGVFQCAGDGRWETVREERHEALADLLADLQATGLTYRFVGQDAVTFADDIRAVLGERALLLPEDAMVAPRAAVCRTLLPHLAPCADVHTLVPNYLQRTEAEQVWMNRQHIEQEEGDNHYVDTIYE